MSPRHTADRLRDILNAIRVIERYRRRGSIEDELVFDGYRMRLIEIGEAAKDLPAELTSTEQDIPWREIARMRDHLSHRYFDTQREIIERVLTDDLKPLAAAVTRLLTRVEQAEADQTQLDFDGEEADGGSEP
ncbi:MAG TPA: HepT-like ribonuclease domain-containing protein [Solirubrobacteraceae bacterium]|nr:HepT-like ribonuclease domain-containing protein [Solirubrobacteraceae bacterium]